LIEYPNSDILKTILDNFTENKIVKLENFSERNKFVFLKLVYKVLLGIKRGILHEKEDELEKYKYILENYIRSCLFSALTRLKHDLTLIIE
jgi:hypothetical protein